MLLAAVTDFQMKPKGRYESKAAYTLPKGKGGQVQVMPPKAVVGLSNCSVWDAQLTAGLSGSIEEELIKEEVRDCRQTKFTNGTKSFWKSCQRKQYLQLLRKLLLHLREENPAFLTRATGFCKLRSDAIQWWIANIWKQLQHLLQTTFLYWSVRDDSRKLLTAQLLWHKSEFSWP